MFNFGSNVGSTFNSAASSMPWNTGGTMGTGGSSWGSIFGDVGKGLSSVMSGLTGIGQIYNAWQANQLAQEQFAFEKAAYRTNLANQATMINNQMTNAANVSAQLGAGTPGNSLATSAAISDYKKKAESNYVSGTM